MNFTDAPKEIWWNYMGFVILAAVKQCTLAG